MLRLRFLFEGVFFQNVYIWQNHLALNNTSKHFSNSEQLFNILDFYNSFYIGLRA